MNEENKSEILIYQTEDGETKVDVRFYDENIWITAKSMTELFQTSKSNISEHIKNIFESKELEASSVVRKFRTTASDGKKYDIEHYNLDMIISIGYRVNSKVGIAFRRWATKILKEYIKKGFVIYKKKICKV